MFRQEVTKKLIDASLQVVQSHATVEHYQQLKNEMTSGLAGGAPEDLMRRLDQIVKDGTDLVKAFDELYDLYSSASLRPAGAMYRIESPTQSSTVRAFSFRSLEFLIAGVLLLTPLIVALIQIFVHDRMRHVERSGQAS